MAFVISVLNGAFQFSPSLSPVFRILFAAPLAAVMACMACRAHRVMVVAFHDPTGSAGTVITGDINFASPEKSYEGAARNHRGQTRVDDTSSIQNSFRDEAC